MTSELQETDRQFVDEQLLTMQQTRAYGEVIVQFEDGRMQLVRMTINFRPPSHKKISEKIVDRTELTQI